MLKNNLGNNQAFIAPRETILSNNQTNLARRSTIHETKCFCFPYFVAIYSNIRTQEKCVCLQIEQLSVPAHSSGQLDKGSTGEENNIAFCSLPLPFVFVVSYCIAKLAFIRFCCVACTDECSEKYIGFMCKCILSRVRIFPCGSNAFWETSICFVDCCAAWQTRRGISGDSQTPC